METIKPIDIRINNWISGKNEPYMRVYAIYQSSVELIIGESVFDYDVKELEPIPLTSDILIKAGFVLEPLTIGTYYLQKGFTDFSILKTLDGVFILFFKGMNCKVYIKYLHNLQNLFSDLGEELTIEL